MYFDPGTGSLIVQLILAAMASFTSFCIAFRVNIKNFFIKLKEKKNAKKDK